MSCGCCEPTGGLTPMTVANRDGLSAIAYRIGTYASFRATMLERISAAPELTRLTTREDDDPSITVLSLWAAVADVLSFYQERYANEAFLRTATQRASVGRLAALIDYRLRPGVAALAWLAFGVEDGKELRVWRGLRVQSVPGQDELPQTFETLGELHAVGALTRLRVLPPPYGQDALVAGATEALLDPGPRGRAAAAALAPRDRVLVWVLGSGGRVEELAVTAVRIEEDRATLVWDAPLRTGFSDDARAAKGGRTFRLFGHTAPESAMTPVNDNKVPGGIRWSLGPTSFKLGASAALALESRVEGIAAGARLLVDDAGGATTLVTVTEVETGARSLGGVTDSVTVLHVTPPVPATNDRRAITIHEVAGPDVVFWSHAYPRRLTGATVVLPGERHEDGTVEVGRTLLRGEYQPGVRVRPADLEPGRPVLVGDAETDPSPGSVLAAAAVGATISVTATAADAATVRQLGLDPKGGAALSGVVSGPVPTAVVLHEPHPELCVRIGDEPTRTLKLAAATPAALQAALRAAGAEPMWAEARVARTDGRLVVLAGGDEAPGVQFLPSEQDATTVVELGLDADHARPIQALLSSPLTPPVAFTAAAPEAGVTIGAIGPVVVSLAGVSAGTMTLFARRLQSAIAAADAAPAFLGTRVRAVGARLLLLPGPFASAPAEFLRIALKLDEPLDLDPATAYVRANVALASHGESVHGEVVGDGDAAASFQRLTLRKRPLTYVPSAQPGGVTSSLQLLVNGVKWEETPALYGQPKTAQVYETRTEDDGTPVLQVGDGETGATLPTGRGNVSATYRVGAGVAGRVRAATLTSALDRPPGLRDVVNPLPATGGADPEAIEGARENAPTTVRTFGRAVSLTDVSDLIRASGEVAKAQSVELWDGLDRAIHVTVAGQAAGVFADTDLRRLGAALQAARDPGSRVLLDNFRPLPIVLRATVTVDDRHVRADVLAAVQAAVQDALSFDNALLGTPLHLSDVYRVIQDVDGVLASDIDELQAKRPAARDRPGADRLPDGTPAPTQAHLQVERAQPDPARPGRIVAAELAVLETPARDLSISATGGLDA
jgi:predicted phage baseplate assembly protein